MSRAELLHKIATLTGGRAAEELILGKDQVTTGASNDIEQATKLARAVITQYGMTDEFDMVAMESIQNKYLSGDTSLTCSAETAAKENEALLHKLAGYLLEKETITGEEFMQIVQQNT